MKNYQTNSNRKVVFYGRVSTEHEAQTYALCNQMQWYEELKKNYPNWIVIERYVNDGITGTQAKKRPEFMRMIDDAKLGKFDLIVTREVSRFARNTIDCLEVTRQLKNYGVEVFFVQEGIWTMENEGEMNLTIRAMVAQEESRKMSERIKAGQAISRKNGVLYGNGNLLGYDRVGDTLGMHKSVNVWTKKLRCRCGSSMRMDKWRPKLNGEKPVGYKCYNQLNKGANKITNRESEGFCDMRAICGWKLEMMAKSVFRKVWKDSDLLEKAIEIFMNETVMEQQDIDRIRNGYRLEIKKLSEKAERLIEMRLNGEIDRDNYLRLKATVDADKKQAEQQLLDYENLPRVSQSHPFSKEQIKKHLLEFISPNTTDFDDNIIDKFVTQIKVESETEFSWYLHFDTKENFNTRKNLMCSFTISFKEALRYRNKRKQLLRQNQYRDLYIKVYI